MDIDSNFLVIGGSDSFDTISISLNAGVPVFSKIANRDIGNFAYSVTKIQGVNFIIVGTTSYAYKYDLALNELDDTGFVFFSGNYEYMRQIS